MKVYVRFLAFQPLLPREFTPIELRDGANRNDLLQFVGEKWGEQLIGYWNKDTRRLSGDILIASQGRILQAEECLSEGQQLQLIGQIIGG